MLGEAFNQGVAGSNPVRSINVKKMAEQFDILKHSLVTEHVKLSDEEKKSLLESLNIRLNQLPMILKSDVAIQQLDPKSGEIIKIIRNSPTNIKQEFYRVIVHG